MLVAVNVCSFLRIRSVEIVSRSTRWYRVLAYFRRNEQNVCLLLPLRYYFRGNEAPTRPGRNYEDIDAKRRSPNFLRYFLFSLFFGGGGV